MHAIAALLITSAIPAFAASHHFPIQVRNQHQGLSPRQIDTFCTTCSDCLGEGYVLCGEIGCYNPDEHQQCCLDGAVCVAEDDSCCEALGLGGPGKPGTDGIPSPTISYVPSFTPTGTPTSFECYRDDTGEDCCARGVNLKYCSGEFPYFGCYLADLESCCDNGEICYGEECCQKLWNAAPVEGGSATVTEAPTGSGTLTTTENLTTDTEGGSMTTTTTTTTSTGGAAEAVLKGMAPLAAGALGLAAWL